MYSSSLQRLLVQAKTEELHRAAHTYNRGRDISRPPTPFSTHIRRAINRLLADGPAVNEEAAPVHRFKLVGHSSAATLRPPS